MTAKTQRAEEHRLTPHLRDPVALRNERRRPNGNTARHSSLRQSRPGCAHAHTVRTLDDKRSRRQAAARDAAASIQLVANETLTNQQYKHYRQPMKRHRAFTSPHRGTRPRQQQPSRRPKKHMNGGRKTSKNQRTNWEIGQCITI